MAFLYRLESEDGSPIGPPTLRTANRSWRVGDTILFPGRTLRVKESTGRTDDFCGVTVPALS